MKDKELEGFCEKLDRFQPNMIREFTRRSADELTRGKITVPQMIILELLRKKDECIMSEIASFLSITTSAVTGLIDRMTKAKLVDRKRGQEDRRVVKIELTLKGKSIIERILQQRRNVLEEIFKNFTKKERCEYLWFVEKIYHILIEGGKGGEGK